MVTTIIILIDFFLGYNIFRKTGTQRLFYFYTGIILSPSNVNILPYSLIAGHAFFVLCFLLSLLYHNEFKSKNFNSPFNVCFILLFISYFLIGLFDDRVGPILGSYRSIWEFITTYFTFYFGWVSLKKSNDTYFIRNILPVSLICTIYGLITLPLQANPILDATGLVNRFFNEFDQSFRSFRVTAFTTSSSVYGMWCFFLFLLGYGSITKKTLFQKFALAMLFLNILISATRAAIIPSILGLILFIFTSKNYKVILSKLALLPIAIIAFLTFSPSNVTKYFSAMTDSIIDVVSPSGSGGSEVVGSNLDAREMQIKASMIYLAEKPLFGHGISYFQEEISNGGKDDRLLGMESYICFLGVEYGIINIIVVLFFYINLLIYFICNIKKEKIYAYMGISLEVMFILFLIYAWVGGNWVFSMPIFGYITKMIYLKKKELTLNLK